MSADVQAKCVGKRPAEAWQTMADHMGFDPSDPTLTGEALFERSEAALRGRWSRARLLPGAMRLLSHLRSAGVPQALCTSTGAAGLGDKLRGRDDVAAAFHVRVTGDCVGPGRGKPRPDPYALAVERLRASDPSLADLRPSECLALEDAATGVASAAAAGLVVVAVPSVRDRRGGVVGGLAPGGSERALCAAVLPSLLAVDPSHATFGRLPPFVGWRAGDPVPLSPPWALAGVVVRGRGRGRPTLGVPTANLDPATLRDPLAAARSSDDERDAAADTGATPARATPPPPPPPPPTELGDAVCGIYCGLATVGSDPRQHAFAMSVGWNPHFAAEDDALESAAEGAEDGGGGAEVPAPPRKPPLRKTVEPWLLHDFGDDHTFYGEELRLVVGGYLREERAFASLPDLRAAIRADGEAALRFLAEGGRREALGGHRALKR